MKNTDKLAALGGTPIFKTMPRWLWPNTNQTTERNLVKLYRSQKWSWNGEWEQRFGKEFARFHTAKHCVFMANGTVTLEGALHVLGVGPGDEVIVPGLTWPATAMAALYNGAKPVFVDIEPDTLCLDPEKVVEAITPRTKAIIPVHLYGSMADMDRLRAIARKHGLHIVEDCAHAHGGSWNGRGLGSIGDIGSFSFQQSKTIASGEGGAVITSSERLREKLFVFKHIGYHPGTKPGAAHDGPPPGLICHNYRGIEFQAALLHGQLGGLKALTVRRNQVTDWLTRELEKIPGVKIQARGRRADRGRQSYYCYCMILDLNQWGGASLKQIMHAFQKENAPIGGTYGTVYRHALWNISPKLYRIHGGWRDAHGPGCRVSEEIGTERTLAMMHPQLDMPRADLTKVVETFAKLQRNVGLLKSIKL